MTSLSIEFNADAAERHLRAFPARTTKATVRALNRTLTSGRATIARLIAKDMGLKASDAKDAVKVQPATATRLEIRLSASKKRLPLIDFGARGPVPSRGKGRGVSYRIGTGGRGRVANAFIATMGSGHRGVYRRSAKGRLPILELFGPSVGRVFDTHKPAAIAQMQQAFAKNLASEMKFAERTDA